MKLLTRYWFELERGPDGVVTYTPWLGITAYDEDDARALLDDYFRRHGYPLTPSVLRLVANVDVSTLDPNHILPNAGPPVWRGVWYPNEVV